MLWVSKSWYGKWSGFCNKYSNWIGKDNYGVILSLALEDIFHWNQWNFMHGSKIECWLIFTCQIKSVHKLVATGTRRVILESDLYTIAKIISFKENILYMLFCCKKCNKIIWILLWHAYLENDECVTPRTWVIYLISPIVAWL